ncbi:hypothetical protein [Mucilaginibacter aquariorum]|uniref:Aminoglycoside phosphotransferase domain-containing protein n=1 Tax=Mucilaginibacter aquariorum TaxID=2967225 RepID=A0ABT1T385_9SPHI|nr:hypothetical protein [Mucilaginibacter aquariorum]MCQ6958731.1 hypothetical protein [Mucilaginibacter aquariorum]
MKSAEIQVLAADLEDRQQTDRARLIETHISWVILIGDFAYKIKKPVRFSFLDFSTCKRRKFFCERELFLNSRLAPQMYLGVFPIYASRKHLSLTNNNGRIVDYAVRMQRMDTAKEMGKLLAAGKVGQKQIVTLAAKLAAFHRSAKVVQRHVDLRALHKRWAELLTVQSLTKKRLGEGCAAILQKAVEYGKRYLKFNSAIISERYKSGAVRDLHGDLHAGNIFLYEEPVIFDCIEFNNDLRQVDMLDELAFLQMDMESYGELELSKLLFEEYSKLMGLATTTAPKGLYQYYKIYRAAVRAKVQIIQSGSASDKAMSLVFANRYLKLLETYISLPPFDPMV